MNLLAADGVRPVSGDVVAVMHDSGLDRDGRRHYRASHNGAANQTRTDRPAQKPVFPVRVCSQALAAASVRQAVDKRVKIDVAALTDVANRAATR
jgi:hypothetical protein